MIGKAKFIIENKEEGYFFDAIKKSKEVICSDSVSESYMVLTKEKLLSCIVTCSRGDFNNYSTISEILNLLSDEVLCSHLSDKDKSLIHTNLGTNYFLLGDMDLALNSYNDAYKYGNTEIYKKIVYMDIFTELPYRDKNFIENGDVEFSRIFNNLSDGKEEINFGNETEADLQEFFMGGFDFINNPNTLQDYIYNLEITEIKWISKLQTFDFDKIDGYEDNISKVETILADKYQEIAEEVNHIDYVYEAFGNMVKRIEGEDVDYLEYGKQLKDFLFTGFHMIDIYLKTGKQDKGLDILEFIVVNGFVNLSTANKDIIVVKIQELINNNSNTIDNNRLNEILIGTINNMALSYKSMIIIGDTFLKISNFGHSCAFYYFASMGDIDVQPKFKGLLEKLLREKDFRNILYYNNDFDPASIITSLLEKLKEGKQLDKDDLNMINNICEL